MNTAHKFGESGDNLPHFHLEEADFERRKRPLDIFEYLEDRKACKTLWNQD